MNIEKEEAVEGETTGRHLSKRQKDMFCTESGLY